MMEISAGSGFKPPELPEICAPRHRLLNYYYRASDRRLVVVHAPGGCGKSLSTMLWLADCGRAAAWFGLDGRDKDLARFYTRFGEGLLSLQPGNRALSKILQSSAFTVSPVEQALRLTRALAPETRRLVLVFDDIHLADCGEIRQSLPLVLQALPASFSSFLLSCDEIPEFLDMPDGASPDPAKERALIGEKDLAFEPEEIRAYFAARGIGMGEAEAEELFAITGGWAMAVNAMAALGLASLGMKGGQAFAEYLKVRIWKNWSRDLRDFMLKTSVPDEFSLATAELLTGRTDCDRILEKLRRENLFIISLAGGMYRYQRLFLEFLRKEPRERARIDFAGLHRVLAFKDLKKGKDAEALRHALLSGDDTCVAAAAENVFKYSAACTEVAAFVEMFRQHFTEKDEENARAAVLKKHPYLLTLFAWYHYLAGEIRPFLAFLDELYAKLPGIRAWHRAFHEGCAMLSTLDPRRSPTGKSGELLAELAADAHEDSCDGSGRGASIQSASLSQNLPFIHRSNRDYSAYTVDLEGSLAAFGATFRPYLREDFKAIEAMLLAGLFYEQNRLDEALNQSLRAFAAMTEETAAELRFSAFMIRAMTLFALGRGGEAREVFADTRRMLEKDKAYYLFPNLYAVETKLLLAEGGSAAATGWLGKFLVSEDGPVELYKSPRHFATARSCIVLGATEKAGSILEGLREMGRDFARPLDMAEAGALLAIARWREQKIGEAVKVLESALETVQAYGFIRVFADEGAALLPVLKKLARRVAKEGYEGPLDFRYVQAIIEAARDGVVPGTGLAFPESGVNIPLSRRQKEILELLARGCTQAGIMRETGLSLPTVKSHCAAVYSKLGVNRARDALARARKLGLIEGKGKKP